MKNTLLFSKDLSLIQMWLMSLAINVCPIISPYMDTLQGFHESHTHFIKHVFKFKVDYTGNMSSREVMSKW